MGTLVQWGAGNIGRSFIGQVFARNGWDVVFIDIDRGLVDLLNEHKGYRVRTVSERGTEILEIGPVSAVDGSDPSAVIEAIVGADMLSFSLGKHILPRVAPLFAQALVARWHRRPAATLDVIIAENMHDGAAVIRDLLAPHLPVDYPLDNLLGLIQTSIGKMVPIQTATDRLEMIAEPFNTLVLDRDACKGPIPRFPQIEAVAPIEAYVDRKLYMHNLGHAVAAYVGFSLHPEMVYLPEVLSDARVMHIVRNAMAEGAQILLAAYPGVFAAEALAAYREDLLQRFCNRALGDTVHRVGRDLVRKLRFDDRLMGAMLTAHRLGTPYGHIATAYAKALAFAATDESGKLFASDRQFLEATASMSLTEKINFAAATEVPPSVLETVKQAARS